MLGCHLHWRASLHMSSQGMYQQHSKRSKAQELCASALSSRTSHWKSSMKLDEVPRKVDTLLEHNRLHSSSMMYAMVLLSTSGFRCGKGQALGPRLGIIDGFTWLCCVLGLERGHAKGSVRGRMLLFGVPFNGELNLRWWRTICCWTLGSKGLDRCWNSRCGTGGHSCAL